MKSKERRHQILSMLSGRTEYLNASKIADTLCVSRQIIVSDIALLRAEGHKIISTPRGYLLESIEHSGYINTIVCRHGREEIEPEFYSIVDNGGVVIDVSVDHPIYGLISASMNIRSRYDVKLFLEQIDQSDAKPLSSLTEGVHTHTIRCQNKEDFERICEELRALGILIEA